MLQSVLLLFPNKLSFSGAEEKVEIVIIYRNSRQKIGILRQGARGIPSEVGAALPGPTAAPIFWR